MQKILFSNFEWAIKRTDNTKIGPGPNYFSDNKDDVFVDDEGLHLHTRADKNRSFSTEVYLEQGLGFGEYSFKVSSRLDNLDPHAIFGAFLYKDDQNEIDIEYGQALAGKSKGQYVIQPWDIKGNVERFKIAPHKDTTHSILWTPEFVTFKSWQGHEDNPSKETLIHEWKYNNKSIEDSNGAKMIFNLWLYKGKKPKKLDEIIIKSFVFRPLNS